MFGGAPGTREQVLNAVLAHLQPLQDDGVLTTLTRRFTLPSEIPPADLPQLAIWEQSEEIVSSGRQPSIYTWTIWLVLSFRNDDKSISGSSVLNPLLDAIERTLDTADVDGYQTLGGLVHYVRIEGPMHKEPGDIDPQGLGGAVIPLRIKTTGV